MEARRAWRALLHWYGEPAPGPTPVPMRVPPSPHVARHPDLGLAPDGRGQQAPAGDPRRGLRRAPAGGVHAPTPCSPGCARAGVGEWTAAETAQRAFGHPDAVSVGDYHVKNWVIYALTGRARGTDEEMLELLAPWTGQRQRVVRLIELTGRGAHVRPALLPERHPRDLSPLLGTP